MPCWPLLSPREHGDEPTTAGPESSSRNRPSGTAAQSAERWKSGQAPGRLSSNPGRALLDQATAPAPGKGALAHCTHCPLWFTESCMGPGALRSHGGGWLRRAPAPACLPQHATAVYLAYCPMCTYALCLQTQETNQEGRRAPKEGTGKAREAMPPAATVCSRQEPLPQPGRAYLGAELGATGMGSLPLQSQRETRDAHRCCVRNPS